MQTAFPFHKGDRARAKAWLEWVKELGGCAAHSIMLMPSKDSGSIEDILILARESWGSVEVLPDGEGISGWPQGPNSNIRQLVWHIWAQRIGPVFHIENDCIPLCAGWLDQFEAEYQRALAAGKLFLGQIVHPADSTPVHLTGNMIMPWDAVIHADALSRRGLSLTGEELAFDITAAPQILPKAYDSKLIQQVWNTNGQPPTFPDLASLGILQPGAVLFHRCKDGSLIQRLREKRNSGACVSGLNVSASRDAQEPEKRAHPPLDWPEGSTPSAPKVYTYFSPVESAEGQAEQQRILAIWHAQWEANGWQPVVLTEKDAQKHQDYESLKDHFVTLPTINQPSYEMACWMRWVAMAAIPGHHLMVDYDCLPFGCEPRDWIDPEGAKYPFMLSGDPKVPFAVMGLQNQFQSLLDLFAEYKAGALANHASDMTVIQEMIPFGSTNWWVFAIAKEYGAEMWQSAKIVHFGHFSCHPRLRSEVMAEAVTFRGKKPETGYVPAGSPAPTTAEIFRSTCKDLVKLIDGKPGRKAQLQTELRSAGLIGAAKVRAKRKK